MSVEELLEMAAEHHWEVTYTVDGELVFFTGEIDESKRSVAEEANEDWDAEDVVEDDLTV
jgi:hypothetical protein